jgi:hypothetical protein
MYRSLIIELVQIAQYQCKNIPASGILISHLSRVSCFPGVFWGLFSIGNITPWSTRSAVLIFHASTYIQYSEYYRRVSYITMAELQHTTRESRLLRTLFCGPRPPPKSCGPIGQVDPSFPEKSSGEVSSAVGE